MKQVLLVFLGGGIGSVARYLIHKWLANTTDKFPLGTFTVNILGSLLIGIILGYAIKNNTLNEQQTLLLATGFCGGFTTFSTFAYENATLFKNGEITTLLLYTIASFTIGIVAVFLGLYLSRQF